MNSLEATRVVTCLDEALSALRLLSVITPDLQKSTEQLENLIGKEFADLLQEHLSAAVSCRDVNSDTAIANTTVEVWRALKHAPMKEAELRQLSGSCSPAMDHLMSCFQQLRQLTNKKLTTTVEEDNSNKEYFEAVCQRDKKASKEKRHLEQQLKLDRKERSTQLQQVLVELEATQTELRECQAHADKQTKLLEDEAADERAQDLRMFTESKTELDKELEGLRSKLSQLASSHKEAEVALQKAKAKREQEVEVWIQKYDDDMGAKEKEYQDELMVFNQINAQLQDTSRVWETLAVERQEWMEAQKIAEQKARLEMEHRNLLHFAAKRIQRNWKNFKARKDAAKKKEKTADKEGGKKPKPKK